MFILLSKSYLIFDKDDVASSGENKCLAIFDLKRDSSKFTEIQWIDLPMKLDSNGSNTHNDVFTCGAFSSSQDFLALVDNQKHIIVFDQYFNKINQFKIKKNASKIIFNQNEDSLFISDKSGNIYEFKLKSIGDSGRLLLGHCSMLLDFTITDDENFIISADRDEKIRVTHYPNTYSIANYCLGHKEFVSSIKLINDHLLVSGSGDGKIMIWDFINGKILFIYDCESKQCTECLTNIEKESKKKSEFAIKTMTIDQKKNGQHLCVSFYTKPIIYLFKIIYNNGNFSLELIYQLILDNAPILISFDLNHINFLWIFGGYTDEPIKLFELKQNQLSKPMIKINVIETLNQNEFFKQAIKKNNQRNLLENLYKNHKNESEYDSNYQHKHKKSRIETKN